MKTLKSMGIVVIAAFALGCLTAVPAGAEELNLRAELAAAIGDPYLMVDLNRQVIVAQLAKTWNAEFVAAYGSLEGASEALGSLHSAALYGAAMATTFAGVQEAIVSNAQASRKLTTKALGDSNSDFSYTPVTPCRLVETRGSFAAVYQGGGAFAGGEVRTYTVQGANGVCTSQLPVGLNPSAVVLQVFGIPVNGSSGDIEILPQGATFGSTATEVYVGNVPFNTVSTTAKVNPTNHQISVQVRGGGAHLAMDVVGYFKQAVGRPSAVQITIASGSIAPFGILFLDAPACSAGTTLVSGGCLTGSFLVSLVASAKEADTDNWFCAFNSTSSLTQSAFASTVCLDTPAKAN